MNVGGTRNVVAALRPDQQLVYASTGSVYGRVDDICDEEHPPEPLTRYGRTKLDGERIAREHGGVALRFATVIGVSPCMRFDLMLNAFIYRAIHFGWLELYQPEDRRSFIDVADAAAAYVFALDHHEAMAGGAFNVGNPDLNLTKREVAEAVARQFPMHIEASSNRIDPDQRNYEVAFDRLDEARLQGHRAVGCVHRPGGVGRASGRRRPALAFRGLIEGGPQRRGRSLARRTSSRNCRLSTV